MMPSISKRPLRVARQHNEYVPMKKTHVMAITHMHILLTRNLMIGTDFSVERVFSLKIFDDRSRSVSWAHYKQRVGLTAPWHIRLFPSSNCNGNVSLGQRCSYKDCNNAEDKKIRMRRKLAATNLDMIQSHSRISQIP